MATSPYRNKNILAILFVGGVGSIGGGLLWLSVTFLIYAMGGSHTDLGTIGAIAVLMSMLSTFIGAYISDRYRRDIVIWFGGLVSLSGVYLLASSQTLTDILYGQMIAQIGWGILGPPFQAIFADSTPSKDKNRVFGTSFMIQMIASAFGNIIGYVIFTVKGSTLSIAPIKYTIWAGFGLSVVQVLGLFLIRDKQTLSVEEEQSYSDTQDTDEVMFSGFSRFSLFVVVTVLASTYLIGLGAGISIPFFPKFFFDVYSLNLADLSLVFAGMTIVTGLWGKITSNLADRFGRIRMIFFTQMIAVVLLYILALYPPLILALLTILVRNAAMNSSGPLVQALMMEYTPRKWRSVVNTIMSFSWSLFFGLGNYFGGRLIDAHGYRPAFIITASLYFVGTIAMLLIKEKREPALLLKSSEPPVEATIIS